jgi:hypothetical protein
MGSPALKEFHSLVSLVGLGNLKPLFCENVVEELAVCLHIVHDKHPEIRRREA